MVQDFLPGFLKAEAEARESMITEMETQVRLARQFCRFDKAMKTCKDSRMQKRLAKYKQEILQLMRS